MTGILGAMLANGGPTIQLLPHTITYGPTGNTTAATVGYALDPDGYVYTSAGIIASYVQAEQWDNAPATTTSFQYLVTVTGDTPSGTGVIGVWTTMPAGTRQTWELIAPRPSGGVTKIATLTVQIRDVATSTVRATATVTLTADST